MSHKSFLSKVAGAALMLFLVGCGDKEEGIVALQSIKVTPSSLALNPGQTGQLTAAAEPENAENVNFKWSSSDHTKATVSPTGLVTAVAEGTAVVTVISGNITKDVTVTVTLSELTSFTVEPEELTLTLGDIPIDLTVTKTPAGAAGVFTYSSSNEDVVTVVDGEVTAVGKGNAVITVASGSLPPKTVPVEVVLPTLTSFTVAPLNLVPGAVEPLTISKTPVLAGPVFTYVSADENVVTVANDGMVTAVGLGATTITVNSDNSLTQTVQVTVTATPDATFDKGNWTVTASGVSGRHAASLLIDNTKHTYWEAAAGETPASFVVDMHGYKSLNGFYLYHPYAAAIAASPKAIEIQTSLDNVRWTTVKQTDNLSTTKDVIKLDLTETVVARYFKVTVTELNSSVASAYLAEIGVYSDAEPYTQPAIQFGFNTIYPCGDVFSWLWEPSLAAELTVDSKGVYVWEGVLTSDGDSEDAFKILTTRTWGGHNIRPLEVWKAITDNSVQAIQATQTPETDDLKWKLYSAEDNGTWRITVDLADMVIVFEKL
jgi:uncharacterized protein YjdB